eukprot:8311983-Pyramimonas_sp.AAC.1
MRLAPQGDCQLGAPPALVKEDASVLDRLEAAASARHLEDGLPRARGPGRVLCLEEASCHAGCA